MATVEINSLIIGVESSLLIEEMSRILTETYDRQSVSINQTNTSMPNTKGVITTAVVINFALGVTTGLTVAVITSMASLAIKKIFNKKEADEASIVVKKDSVSIKISDKVEVTVVIKE